MAENDIRLNLKAENRQLRAKLKQSEKDLEKFGKKGKETSSGMKDSFLSMKTVIAGVVVAAGAKLIQLAGQVDAVTNSFDVMTQRAGASGDALLAAMQKATRGTVDNLELMKSANLAMTLLGDEAIENLPKMAEIAFAAARIQGKNVKDMMNDIVVATGRQSIMILDNLGISSATAARGQEEFAASLGKTRDQLTASEKKAGFFFATMKAGQELIDKVDTSTLSFNERLQVLKTRFNNVQQDMSRRLIPGFENLIDIMNLDLGGTPLIGTLINGFNRITGGLMVLVTIIKSIPAFLSVMLSEMRANLVNFFGDVKSGINKLIGRELFKVKEDEGPTIGEISAQAEALNNISTAIKKMQSRLEKVAKVTFPQLKKAGKSATDDIKKSFNELQKNLGVLRSMVSAFKSATEKDFPKFLQSFGQVAGAVNKEAGMIISTVGFVAGTVQDMLKTTKDNTAELERQEVLQEQLLAFEEARLEALQAKLELEQAILNTIIAQRDIKNEMADEANFQFKQASTLAGLEKEIAFLQSDLLTKQTQQGISAGSKNILGAGLGFSGAFNKSDVLLALEEIGTDITSTKGKKLEAERAEELLAELQPELTAALLVAQAFSGGGSLAGQASAAQGIRHARIVIKEAQRLQEQLAQSGSAARIQETIDEMDQRKTNLETLKQSIDAVRQIDADILALELDIADLEIKREKLRQEAIDDLFKRLEEQLKILDLQKELEFITAEFWESEKRRILNEMLSALDAEKDKLEYLRILKRLADLDQKENDAINQRANLHLTGQRNKSIVDIGTRGIRNLFGGGISSTASELANVSLPGAVAGAARSLGTQRTKSISERSMDAVVSIDGKMSINNQLLSQIVATTSNGGGLAAQQAFDNAIIEAQQRIGARVI